MKVCVFGVGAIGSHLAARLMAAGEAEVSLVARGAQLAAIRANGVRLRSNGGEIGGRPHAATDDPSSLSPQDLVVVTLKAHAQSQAAQAIADLIARDGAALFIANGVPFWWNRGWRDAEGPLETVDPGGELWRALSPDRAMGCVVHSSNRVVEHGVVEHGGGDSWIIGEPSGAATPRAERAVALLRRAGLNSSLSRDLRREVWRKLCVNVAGNPIAALTRLPSGESGRTPGIPDLAQKLIDETLAVAAAGGWSLRAEIDSAALAHRTPSGRGNVPSMLQDVRAGRAIEVDAILGQVAAFGRAWGIPTPAMDCVTPLLRGLDRSLRLALEKGGQHNG